MELLGLFLLAGAALLGAVLGHPDYPPERDRLAGPDDQDLDFAAAVETCGPLPRWSEEVEALRKGEPCR